MLSNFPTAPRSRRVLAARRLVLLASVAGLGTAVLLTSPGAPQLGLPSFAAAARADTAQRPVGFADIVEKVKPAVISVRVKVDGGARTGLSSRDLPPGLEQFFRRFGMPDVSPDEQPRGGQRHNFVMGQGSGFFISADGFAVTNNHVVDKADSVEVTSDDGKSYTAKVIGTDSKTDLALIKIEGRSDFPFVKLSDTNPRVGDWVLAVGNPFGLGGTVTAGIISARGRDIGAGPYDDFIHIDAPVNKGNSGGPTFDMDGNVIGVNTAIFSPSGGSVGIGFDIPANTAKTVVAQLKDHGSVERGWLGVRIQPVTSDIADSLGLKKAEGALVDESNASGPAAKAGIVAGDVIIAINDTAVKDARDLARKIGTIAPGTSVKLTVLHKGDQKTIDLTLGTLSNEKQAKADGGSDSSLNGLPRLGLSLAPAKEVAGSGDQGVAVVEVDPSSLAAERGFKTGDVILEVAGKSVANATDVRKALSEALTAGKKTVLLRVKSAEATRFVALPIAKA